MELRIKITRHAIVRTRLFEAKNRTVVVGCFGPPGLAMTNMGVTMNRRLIVLDDEKGILEAYSGILSPDTKVALQSSRKLIVEDSELPIPYEITYFSLAHEALDFIAKSLRDNRPLCGGFFDVKLGSGIDGIESIRRAKNLDPRMTCVIVTAYQDRSVEEIQNILGADFSDRWDFLNKPFSRGEIIQKANHIVSVWNQNEKKHCDLLNKSSEVEQDNLLRELMDDALTSLRDSTNTLISRQNDPKLKSELKKISEAIGQCQELNHVVSEGLESSKLKKVG